MTARHAINRVVRLLGSAAVVGAVCTGCSASSATPVPASPVAVAATLTPSGTPSPTAPAIDPCSLATQAQVRAALGGSVAASQLDLTNTAIPTCLWTVTDSKIGTGTLRIAITGLKGTATTFSAMQKSFAAAKAIIGLGDQAFAVDPIGQVILFRNGTTLTLAASGFVLQGADPPRADVQAALTIVGKSAAAHL